MLFQESLAAKPSSFETQGPIVLGHQPLLQLLTKLKETQQSLDSGFGFLGWKDWIHMSAKAWTHKCQPLLKEPVLNSILLIIQYFSSVHWSAKAFSKGSILRSQSYSKRWSWGSRLYYGSASCSGSKAISSVFKISLQELLVPTGSMVTMMAQVHCFESLKHSLTWICLRSECPSYCTR